MSHTPEIVVKVAFVGRLRPGCGEYVPMARVITFLLVAAIATVTVAWVAFLTQGFSRRTTRHIA